MDAGLTYRKGLTWTLLNERGRGLARVAFVKLLEHVDPTQFHVLQQKIRFQIGPATELCYPDLLCYGRETADGPWSFGILDFKTGERLENPLIIETDEQLTDYQLAVSQAYPERRVEWLALFRAIWTAEPKVQLLWTKARTQEELQAFAAEAISVDRLIKAEEFHRNYASCMEWGGCWAQPLCLSSQRERRDAELFQDLKDAPESGEVLEDIAV